MAHIVFAIICFLIDEILTVIFPNSYLINDLLFIPNSGFCAVVLAIRRFSFLNSYLFVFGCGMICDSCFANMFLFYTVIYTVIVRLLQLWSKHMMETLIESLTLCTVTIFIKDLLMYCYMSSQRITSMSLMLWAERYELMTLLANAILAMVTVLLIRIKGGYLEVKVLHIRKEEEVERLRLKLRE